MGFVDAIGSRAVRICIAYAIISMSISMTYKGVLSGFKYDSKFIMLSQQLAASLIFCLTAKRLFKGIPGLEVPDFSVDTLRRSSLSGVLFVLNIVVGWYGLQLVNIPLFLCIRRTTTAFTLLTEYLILGRRQSWAVMASVGLIMLGAIVAGSDSLTSDWTGVAYTLMNNVLTAIAMSVTKRFSDKTGTQGFGLVYYNSLVALPLALVGATAFNEWHYTATYSRVGEPGFWVAMFLASVMGLVMTYTALLCSTVNSPLITSVTGNAKDIFLTAAGALVFGDFNPTTTAIGGIVLSFVGAGLFSYAKLKEAGTPVAKTAAAGGATAPGASTSAPAALAQAPSTSAKSAADGSDLEAGAGAHPAAAGDESAAGAGGEEGESEDKPLLERPAGGGSPGVGGPASPPVAPPRGAISRGRTSV